VRIIGSDGRPEPIPAEEIESLMIVMNNRAGYDLHPYLQVGMPVEVIRGPLQGVKGRLVRHSRHCRVVISISLIQQAVVVEIDAANIAPIAGTCQSHETGGGRGDWADARHVKRDPCTEQSRSLEM
jgi:transcription antitermination factor NusG